jgi:hypothetical protein
MSTLLILGIIVSILIISAILSWVCYKKFTCENVEGDYYGIGF